MRGRSYENYLRIWQFENLDMSLSIQIRERARINICLQLLNCYTVESLESGVWSLDQPDS